jgi:membrane-bound lytic murein transglycosylase B
LLKTLTHLTFDLIPKLAPQYKRAFSLVLTVSFLSACANLPSISTSSTTENTGAHSQPNHIAEAEEKPESLKPFLEQLALNHHIPLVDLQIAFQDAKTIPSVKKLVLPPTPGFQKNWKVYRSRFIEPRRFAAGQQFWKKHQDFIQKTSDKTGIPGEIIVSIIGVETIYGRNMGSFSVRDTLLTLGFSYPETPNKKTRETLFKNQLEDLVVLCWKENSKAVAFEKCLTQSGSYAGAIGLPQFMPGSILRFAVDGDLDGKIDLRHSPEDAIASVANFLKEHGWVNGEPVYFDLKDDQDAPMSAKQLADGAPVAKLQLGDLVTKNIIDKTELPDETPSLIVDLPSPGNDGGTEVRYVVGLRNFIAICEYNRSFFYAQSVAEFAEVLRGEMPINETSSKKKNKATKKSKPKNKTKKKPATQAT